MGAILLTNNIIVIIIVIIAVMFRLSQGVLGRKWTPFCHGLKVFIKHSFSAYKYVHVN